MIDCANIYCCYANILPKLSSCLYRILLLRMVTFIINLYWLSYIYILQRKTHFLATFNSSFNFAYTIHLIQSKQYLSGKVSSSNLFKDWKLNTHLSFAKMFVNKTFLIYWLSSLRCYKSSVSIKYNWPHNRILNKET